MGEKFKPIKVLWKINQQLTTCKDSLLPRKAATDGMILLTSKLY